ncbi:hypothetical protein PSM7751_03912 [Pseudooceanicola marinus]|uniref:Uncharacterized protein n=1 Tax=Pseudooceanicola marinus TaxID=396013 RepID=A0A1X7A7A8_9RHOB|nr:hypothetical protein [Pseudooceanicola marinus]SLN72435.1 hypothetical protein PSM7751_03912 [Pseudooceanicola marinus]
MASSDLEHADLQKNFMDVRSVRNQAVRAKRSESRLSALRVGA